MASRRIAVDITGDPTNLERALNQSQAAIREFGQKTSKQVGGTFDKLDSSLRVRARRASSLGPLRLAGIGLGAGTALFGATQAASRLGDSLQTTGEKAFTTEGRIKNLGASLLSGDLVGGIKAMSDLPKTLDQAGISATEAVQHFDAFKAMASPESGPFAALAKQAVQLATNIRVAAAAQDALNWSLRQTNVLASGAQVAIGTRPDDLGPRGPGAIAAEQAGRRANPEGPRGRFFHPIGPATKNQAAQLVAQAQGNLPELLRLQNIALARATRDIAIHPRASVKTRQALKIAQAQAQAAVISTQQQISDAAKQTSEDAKAAAEKAKGDREAARAKALAAMRKAAAAAKKFREELLKGAEDLRDAAIKSLDRATEKRNIARELGAAQEKLALAKRLGSPGAVREARQNIQDIRTDRLRLQLESAKLTPTKVGMPGGPRATATSGVTVHIGNITLPGIHNANQLLRELQRIPVATSRRGHHSGTKHGI